MAIISHNRYPQVQDLSIGLQNVLRRNGMQAHLSTDAAGNFQLVVLGHDSPAITYKITNQQAKALMDWQDNGVGSVKKKAYNTFVSIVKNDFDVPASAVVAFNAGGAVNIGQYGYRLNHGEFGLGRPFIPIHHGMRGWGGDFLGWRPRYGLRRGSIHVLERPDGSLRPGEVPSTRMLTRGGKASSMGFYYKGNPTPQNEATLIELDSVVDRIEPIVAAPRHQGDAVKYSDVIKSDVYFSQEKWLEVLRSHGILLDEKNGHYSMTQQFGSTRVDKSYDLTEAEYKTLTAEHLDGADGVPLDQRLALLNNIFGEDFQTQEHPITKEMLNDKEIIAIPWKEESRLREEAPFIEYERQKAEAEQHAESIRLQQQEEERIKLDPNAINGRDAARLGFGWFNITAHGRELEVGEIRVDKTAGEHYLMTAEINGHRVNKPISAKQYEEFLAVDDIHRMKLFDKVFKEVEMKRSHGCSNGEDLNCTNAQVAGKDLRQLNESKAFYREGKHGREVEVGDISVEQMASGKYKMTAVLDGVAVSHEISQKEYDRFLAVDDYHRMKMFSKIFDEVDMKTRPGMGVNVGVAVLAALIGVHEAIHIGMDIAHGPRPMHRPEMYTSHFKAEGYVKPGVAMGVPAISAANFERIEQGNRTPDIHEGLGRGV